MRTGRPPKDAEDKRTESIHIRISPSEKDTFYGYAKRHQISLADTLVLGLILLEDDEKKNEDC